MSADILCHLLIGLPSSGKSTLAEQMQFIIPNSRIVSTDRIRQELYGDASYQGEWSDIEAVILIQVQSAIAQNCSVIYDATNAQRVWRMTLLHKLAEIAPNWVGWHLKTPRQTCHQWNQQRDRIVPRAVIDRYDQQLRQFPPIAAEGFIAVYDITPHNSLSQIQRRLQGLSRSITNRTNRTQHQQIQFHYYSSLLNFDRLMHLIHLLVQYPGIGTFHTDNPTQLSHLLKNTDRIITTAIDEICAVLTQQQGSLYADPSGICHDLDWLEMNGFLSPKPVTTPLTCISAPSQPPNPHPYSDWESFQRLLLMVRFISHHPFCWNNNLPSSLSSLLASMQHHGLLQGDYESALRKDVEQVLKPFGILPPFRLRRGYFIGTGIVSEQQLLQITGLLQSQAKNIQDPLALSILDTLRERLRRSQYDLDTIYPVRAIANRMIIDPEGLPADAIARRPEVIETAIEAGQLLELKRYSGAGRFDTEHSNSFFKAWPLQLIFHNIAWYLGYELADGPEKGLLNVERLDRLFLGRNYPTKQRSRSAQLKALHRLQALQQACSGLYLGNRAQDQKAYLSRDADRRASASFQLELWFTDRVFAFVSEGTQRFPVSQMRMSPMHQRQAAKYSRLFSLKPSSDRQYPHRLQVNLPIWSCDDVDLRRWILGFGADVKVMSPTILRQSIAQIGHRVSELYDADR
jgi:predicted kinase